MLIVQNLNVFFNFSLYMLCMSCLDSDRVSFFAVLLRFPSISTLLSCLGYFPTFLKLQPLRALRPSWVRFVVPNISRYVVVGYFQQVRRYHPR